MDSIKSINIKKDTSFAMLIEAQNRGYSIYYMEMQSLYMHGNEAMASTYLLSVKQSKNDWYKFHEKQDIKLSSLDIILMRKNPPFNIEFIYVTYILEHAENTGTLIVNKPRSLRDCNEKLFITWFNNYIPDTLVSCKSYHIRKFLEKNQDVIIKPLDSMGGKSIFRVKQNDPNLSVIIETVTNYEQNYCMIQKYLPDINYGDKRILIIDGAPVPYCLTRIPKEGETRGNLMAGGIGKAYPLSNSDWEIARHVAPILKNKGLLFVGLDIIGNYLIEINVTSPTCVCEIENTFSISIIGMFMDSIEKRLAKIK